jgi:nicotinamidase-related amidase
MPDSHHPLSPKKEELALIIIDAQNSLMKVMEPEVKQKTVNNIRLLIASAQKLNIPLVLTEQYPKGLGKTVTEVQKSLENYQPIEKVSFSCYDDQGFKSKLKQLNSTKGVILAGVETHICVLQTALDLLACGYQVYVISDAVCSRRKLDWEIGLRLMEKAGAIITTTETLIFQLLIRADTEEFKSVSKLLG